MKGDLIKFPNIKIGGEQTCPMSIRIPAKQIKAIPDCLIDIIVEHCKGMGITCLGLIMDTHMAINSYSKYLVEHEEQNRAIDSILTLFTEKEISRYKGRPIRLKNLAINKLKYPGIAKTVFYFKKGLYFLVSSMHYISRNAEDVIAKHLIDAIIILLRHGDGPLFLELIKSHKEILEEITPPYLFNKFEHGLCVVENPRFVEVGAKETTQIRRADSTKMEMNTNKENKQHLGTSESNPSKKVSNFGHIEKKRTAYLHSNQNSPSMIIGGLKPGMLSGL